MTNGQSEVFKKPNSQYESKSFSSAFDIMLQKHIHKTDIQSINIINKDKILNFCLSKKSSYKQTTINIQFEFTSRRTNVIILNQQGEVVEALRHISSAVSTRVVKVGYVLENPPKPQFEPIQKKIEDMDQYLYAIYHKRYQNSLKNTKTQKLNAVKKNHKKLQTLYDRFEDIQQLNKQLINNTKQAKNIIESIYLKTGYEKSKAVKLSNDMFKKSKKLKQKIQNQHIEQTNIKEKLEFFDKAIHTIQNSNSIEELEFYFPKKQKQKNKAKPKAPYKQFVYGEYIIRLGRNENENIYLLKHSKSSDIWFHLKDRPSCHLFVSTRKKQLPEELLEKCAIIVAKFSTKFGGDFLVDYTKRSNVKVVSKANVTYKEFKTIKIRI
jgi:predicted ribosome quality control (RQC) complex YloA/Tae2 family protein